MVKPAGPIATENDCAVTDPELSLTCKVKPKLPGPVGVPLKTPALDRANPDGNAPETVENVYGAVPPLAVMPCE